jgi:hypothetical protein
MAQVEPRRAGTLQAERKGIFLAAIAETTVTLTPATPTPPAEKTRPELELISHLTRTHHETPSGPPVEAPIALSSHSMSLCDVSPSATLDSSTLKTPRIRPSRRLKFCPLPTHLC